jgi:ferredoxin-NADP reductase
MTVAGREQECADVVSLRLTSAGGLLPRWQPGAHLRVELPSGLIKHYSLCGDMRDRGSYTIAVRLLPGAGGSAEVHSSLVVGSTLRVLGPAQRLPVRGRAGAAVQSPTASASLPCCR